MKTNIKRILLLLTAVLLLACLGVTVSASSVSYAGGAEDFVFLPGSEYSDTDLFENFKNIMPGDTREQQITVKNDWREADYVKIYLRAVPHDDETNPLSESVAASETIATMTDFLSQLTLKVYNGDTLIFDGNAAETDGLSENVLLGSFDYGEETTLNAVLEVPLTMGNEYQGRIGEVDWIFTVERHNDPIDIPTITEKTTMTVKKLWKDSGVIRPDSIEAVLLRNGEEVDEVTLSEDNNWTYTWDKLSLSDDWDVVEKEVPDGYRVSYYSTAGYVLISNIELDRELTVEKVWVDEDPAERTESVTAQLIRDGKVADEVILNDANDWTYTWSGLDRAYNWTVREADVPEGYTVSYEYDDEEDRVLIINTWDAESEPVSWTVQKVWNANGAVIPESVTADLIGDGEVVETVTLSADNDWTYTWDELDGSVNWTIVETNIPEGWTAAYDVSGSIMTITNTSVVPQTITVNKVWDDNNSADRPTFVTVQLYNGETAVESIQLGEWNGWTYTWTDLDGSGDWYVAETETVGYVPSYIKDGSTVTITNTATLIQTGQLKWPVAVLCGGGLLMILGGIFFMTRKKKEDNA